MKKRGLILANIATVVLILVITVIQGGKLFGKKTDQLLEFSSSVEVVRPSDKQLQALNVSDQISEVSEGVWKAGKKKIYSTQIASQDYTGFSGPVPSFVVVNEAGLIEKIVLGEHDETASYLEHALKHGLLKQWIGTNIDKVSSKKVNAVSGATYTSNAVNGSLRATFAGGVASSGFGLKTVAAIIVLIWGCVASFIHKKNRHIRTLTLLSNTLVLGFWCGHFLSISSFQGWLINGFSISSKPVMCTMLILFVFMTLVLVKKSFYCTWVCPFGALQELLGKVSKKKIPIKGKVAKALNQLRMVITLLVILLMWTGTSLAIADYEVFAAFMITSASTMVVALGIVSCIMAVFIPKPYCRYICPTGQLLAWTNKLN